MYLDYRQHIKLLQWDSMSELVSSSSWIWLLQWNRVEYYEARILQLENVIISKRGILSYKIQYLNHNVNRGSQANKFQWIASVDSWLVVETHFDIYAKKKHANKHWITFCIFNEPAPHVESAQFTHFGHTHSDVHTYTSNMLPRVCVFTVENGIKCMPATIESLNWWGGWWWCTTWVSK